MGHRRDAAICPRPVGPNHRESWTELISPNPRIAELVPKVRNMGEVNSNRGLFAHSHNERGVNFMAREWSLTEIKVPTLYVTFFGSSSKQFSYSDPWRDAVIGVNRRAKIM
jgi:hypothetical protein